MEPCRYCPECGADMQRASALELAARRESGSGELGETHSTWTPTGDADRRLTESNQAWLGKVVDGRYRVIEVAGRGGMGVVYKVEHLRMGKIAAMKVLHRDLAHDLEVVHRFEREAAAVSRLNHPNTVQVFDFGAAQGALYLIMEYVRGQDLARIVERDGPLTWERAAPIFTQVCGALQEAHELGIVHRDLKPENVLITRGPNGRDYAKVLDFGLAKLGAIDVPSDATDRSRIVGTPYYMAPEQIRGDEVDGRADIYALGTMMFKVLTGEYLYTAKNAVGVLTKHLTAEIDAPSQRTPMRGIDPRVDTICLRALAKEPTDRYQTVAEMAEEIQEVYAEVLGDASGAAKRLSVPVGGWATEEVPAGGSDFRLRRADLDAYERSLRRRNALMVAAAIGVVLAIAGAGAYLLLRPEQTRVAELEPNDEITDATRIAANTEVTGLLGRRRSRSEGDRDVYRVAWGSGQPRLVTVSVGAPPNIDVRLVLHDDAGAEIARADEGGVGVGEAVKRRRIKGPLMVKVEETIASGQSLPTENVSDRYTLSVREEADVPGWEAEPNSGANDASVLAPGARVSGYLDARGDEDVLKWTGPNGKVRVVVTATEVPLTWRTGDGQPRPQGAAVVELRTGELLRLERADRERVKGAALPGADAPWSVTATPER
jgi:tRNA A-37 threonylcarbamoyl transferase component Bud32